MGRLNTTAERRRTILWAQELKSFNRDIEEPTTLHRVKEAFGDELNKYFSLACLSRHKSENRKLVVEAQSQVFRVRKLIENSIEGAIKSIIINGKLANSLSILCKGFYGSSKKQGTSVRMPLTTCHPTILCSSACYAHDTLDAAPYSVVRGVVNGLIANCFERGNYEERKIVLDGLEPHTCQAVKSAIMELDNLPIGYLRRPNIRLSHVGEIASFPEFTNALAKQVYDMSSGEVTCAIYTRHKNVSKLDPELLVINFTLDEESLERRAWIPPEARVTYAAFGGRISSDVEVNFLEHHRWKHYSPQGDGTICPATHPDTKERTCDACKCNLCFTRPSVQNCAAI